MLRSGAPEKSRRKMKNHESKYAAEPRTESLMTATTVRCTTEGGTAKGKSNGESISGGRSQTLHGLGNRKMQRIRHHKLLVDWPHIR